MKILFVCGQGKNRSKTAEKIFKDKYGTKSIGVYNENSFTEEKLEWADLIAVMEEDHIYEIAKKFPRIYLRKQIINLDIPDVYGYMQSNLVKILKEKFKKVMSLTIV